MALPRQNHAALDAAEGDDRAALERLLSHLLPDAAVSEVACHLMDRYGRLSAIAASQEAELLAAAPGLTPAAARLIRRIGLASRDLARIAAVAAPPPPRTALPPPAEPGGMRAASPPGAIPREARAAAGQWLRALRDAAGLSQADLAARVGSPSATIIDQLEAGHGRIAWSRAGAWAAALGLAPRDFALGLLRHYEPHLSALLDPAAPGDCPDAAEIGGACRAAAC